MWAGWSDVGRNGAECSDESLRAQIGHGVELNLFLRTLGACPPPWLAVDALFHLFTNQDKCYSEKNLKPKLVVSVY